MATLEPSRLDVVMTPIAGLDQTVDAEFRRDSFGLHLGPEVSPEQLALMGRRHGFRLPDGAVLRADATPNAYVELTRDVPLEEVLEAVLSTEAGVRTVNLNYVER